MDGALPPTQALHARERGERSYHPPPRVTHVSHTRPQFQRDATLAGSSHAPPPTRWPSRAHADTNTAERQEQTAGTARPEHTAPRRLDSTQQQQAESAAAPRQCPRVSCVLHTARPHPRPDALSHANHGRSDGQIRERDGQAEAARAWWRCRTVRRKKTLALASAARAGKTGLAHQFDPFGMPLQRTWKYYIKYIQ